MDQVVSLHHLSAEAQVRARVSACGVCYGQSDNVEVLLRIIRFYPVSIIPRRFFILIHHPGNKQLAPWWPQFGDVISPNRREQQQDN
jgi:hypothetical protein